MVPNSFSPMQVLPRNRRGRDFVTGDIHGAFELVIQALDQVDFNPQTDRLLSTGDLVDRGEHSGSVRQFLELPFVHCVRGNHEQMALDAFTSDGELTDITQVPHLIRNGMAWWLHLTPAERLPILQDLAKLPFVLQTETARGLVGVLHADVPVGMDWPSFIALVRAGDRRTLQTCLWGRKRLTEEVHHGVAGVGRIFVGHTPQWSGVRRYGNVYAIDTGAVYGQLGIAEEGALTVTNLLTATDALATQRPAHLLNVVDSPPPAGVVFSQGPGYIARL